MASRRWASALFDLLVFVLVAIALTGGFPWNGKTLLPFAADLRRAVLILGLLAAWKSESIREGSLFLRAVRWFLAQLEETRWRWAVLGFVMLWAIGLSVFQTLAIQYPLYDVGLFHQIVWSLSHGHGYWSSISKAGDFLLDHLSYTLAFWVPFFKLSGDSLVALPVIHSVLLYAGVASWVWFAERAPGMEAKARRTFAAAALIAGICFDSLWGNRRWGFHENSIAFASISWALALHFAGDSARIRGALRKALVLGLLLIAAGSKEILLVDVALLLLCWAADEALQSRGSNRPLSRKAALPALLVFTAAVLLAWFVRFETIPHPADKNYFDRYYSYLGRNLRDFFLNLLTRPWIVPETIGYGELARYLWGIFAPWLFLPLLSWGLLRRWVKGSQADLGTTRFRFFWLLGFAPSFSSCVLSTYPPLRYIDYHYALECWPVLALVTLLTLARLRSMRLIWIFAFVMALRMASDPWEEMRDYLRLARDYAPLREVLTTIPVEDSVSAEHMSSTLTAGRRLSSRWPDLMFFPNGCPDWIVFRDAPDAWAPDQVAPTALRCAGSPVEPVRVREWAIYRLKKS